MSLIRNEVTVKSGKWKHSCAHPYIVLSPYPTQGHRGAEAYPICHRVRGAPRQVASLSEQP